MTEPEQFPLAALLAPDGLSGRNRLVLDYWLSLRRGPNLPRRADFNPAHVRPALARLCLFDAKAGERLSCRLAGSAVAQGLGAEISGRDFRSFTPPQQRRNRLDTYHRVLGGMVMRNDRTAMLTTGRRMDWQELILPFGDIQEDGSQQVLIAADFGPLDYRERVVSIPEALGAPIRAAFFSE